MYVHDLTVKKCGASYLLLAAGIYDDTVMLFNVDVPTNPVMLLQFPDTHGMAHNVAMDDLCSVIYVTHEMQHEPIR
jgi:hypothetical protein